MAPTVTIVFLVYNRREELRHSLERMLQESDYERDAVDVIVVDNASDDGSAAMVEAEFPGVRLIRREVNCGVSGWNDGFREARGDYVLALDDDCYLPPDGLRRAVEQGQQHDADLVSFAVRALDDPDYRFTEKYRTGLLTYWGCAVLIRRGVLKTLRGYDPEIFVWANELELMLRFFDHGWRHLHAPEILAVHMKDTSKHPGLEAARLRAYLYNNRHFAYIAAKLLRPHDAAGALLALLVGNARDALRWDRNALQATPQCIQGFIRGVRNRAPVDNRELSRTYRRNFHSFASPWWISRSPASLLRAAPRELLHLAQGGDRDLLARPPGRRSEYYAERSKFYPATAATLEFKPTPSYIALASET